VLIVNDAALLLVALLLIPAAWGLNRVRPWLRTRLAERVGSDPDDPFGAPPAR